VKPEMYQRRPTHVTAVRWDGTPGDAAEIAAWACSQGCLSFYVPEAPGYDNPIVTVTTEEGTACLSTGDWIVCDSAGRWEHFDATEFTIRFERSKVGV